MSKTVFDLKRGTSQLNTEQGNRPQTSDIFIFGYYESVGIEHSGIKVYDRDVSYDGAWGKGFGDGISKNDYNWGETGAEWQGSYTNSREIIYVLNPTGTFYDHFVDEEFINTSASSATLSLGASGNITIGTSETFESEIVHNNDVNVTEIRYYINDNLVTNYSDLKVEVSTNDGSNYEEVTVGSEHLMNTANVGKKVKYKLTNTGTSDIIIDTSYDTNNNMVSLEIN